MRIKYTHSDYQNAAHIRYLSVSLTVLEYTQLQNLKISILAFLYFF